MIKILVGMISSGKTTYCKQKAQEGYICINDDAIVTMLHGNDYTLYEKKLKPLYKAIENSIFGLTMAANKETIIDRGLNISVDSRKRWVALARSFDTYCEAVIFKNEGPEVHARRRFDSDNRGCSYDYWLTVATEHNKRRQYPTIGEGFAVVTYL